MARKLYNADLGDLRRLGASYGIEVRYIGQGAGYHWRFQVGSKVFDGYTGFARSAWVVAISQAKRTRGVKSA
jgi:hypothetical protein